jgi:hypothetical protein
MRAECIGSCTHAGRCWLSCVDCTSRWTQLLCHSICAAYVQLLCRLQSSEYSVCSNMRRLRY